MDLASVFENRDVFVVDKSLLKDDFSNSKVIVLSVLDDPKVLTKIIESVRHDNLTKRIKNLELKNKLLLQEQRKNELLERFGLSTSEKKVFNYIEKGMVRSEIAKELMLSEITVRNTITRILKKMEVKNSQQAVEKLRNMINDEMVLI